MTRFENQIQTNFKEKCVSSFNNFIDIWQNIIIWIYIMMWYIIDLDFFFLLCE